MRQKFSFSAIAAAAVTATLRFPFTPFPRVTKTSSARKRVPLPFPPATVNTSQGGYSWRDPGNWEIEPNLARINYSSLGRIIFAFKECARGEFGCGDRIKGAGAPPYRVIECENKEVPRDVRSKRDGGGGVGEGVTLSRLPRTEQLHFN